MTLEIEQTPVQGHRAHLVLFYENDAELACSAGRYLLEAAREGAVSLVIATKAHRHSLEAELEAGGVDVSRARDEGTLVLLDAAATMSRFISPGHVEAAAFREVIGGVVREAARSGRPIRAYGEMVALLWEAGDVLAAIELEKLWNELGEELPFSLLCAYRSEAVSGSEHAAALRKVCQLHSAVLGGPIGRQAKAHHTHDQLTGHFGAEPGAPRCARHFIAQALHEWGQRGTIAQDVQLVVSELATNAVMHAGSHFSVTATRMGGGIRVSVEDASPAEPVLRAGGPSSSSGRGLHLVSLLCSDWGVDATPGGKVVWAELRP